MSIVPRRCRFFQQDLTYLFYGGLFYRTSADPTDDALKLPIGFLFAPSSLTKIDRYYPMDSGAVHTGRLTVPDSLDDYSIPSQADPATPARIVRLLFDTNHNYLVGHHRESKSSGSSLDRLLDCFAATRRVSGIDKRAMSIEALARVPIPLSLENLLWVGYPHACEPAMSDMMRQQWPNRVARWRYGFHQFFRPLEIEALLESEASAFVARHLE